MKIKIDDRSKKNKTQFVLMSKCNLIGILTLILFSACWCNRNPPPPLPTINGPEATDFLPKGYIIIDRPVEDIVKSKGGIFAIELPVNLIQISW